MIARRSKLIYLLVGFCCGVGTVITAPILGHQIDKFVLPEKRVEVTRATSPDGLVDAVMMVEGCGPLCADRSSVSVVPKGAGFSEEAARRVLIADDLAGGKLVWKQSHLLEIIYDHGLIEGYLSVTHPFAKPGVRDSWQYEVETRLAPTSPDFSYLKKEIMNK